GFERPVDAQGGLADHTQIVERDGGGWAVGLHDTCSRLSASRPASVRSASCSLNALCSVGVAPASNPAITALAPLGNSASAASMRHGLWATPPSATRPVPSGCSTSPTETTAKA